MADRSYTTCLLFRAGAALACFIALMMAVPAIGLLFGVPVMGWMVPFAFALAVLLVALASESGTPRCTLRAGLIALVAVVLATVACGCVLDLSYDGNTHHKQAVAFLAQGWNQLGGSVAGFSAFQELYPSGDAIQLWIDHYARGPWLYGAALYDLTGWIEAGKSYTLVSMLAAGIMLGAFLARRGFAGWQCALVALLAVVNPITVPQMITYYNDAVLMMCLLLMLQEAITGEAFITWWPFALAMFISKSAHDLTLYRYHRRKYNLITGLICLIPPVLTIFVIAQKGL